MTMAFSSFHLLSLSSQRIWDAGIGASRVYSLALQFGTYTPSKRLSMSSFLGPQLMATRSHALPLQPAANQNQLYKGDCLFAHLPDAVCNSKTVNLRQLHEAMGHLQPHPWACRRQQFCPCAWFLLKPLTELPLGSLATDQPSAQVCFSSLNRTAS